jgi:hypothetical protein
MGDQPRAQPWFDMMTFLSIFFLSLFFLHDTNHQGHGLRLVRTVCTHIESNQNF